MHDNPLRIIQHEVHRVARQGVTLDAEPHDTEWKTRAFEITEPSGFKMTIVSAT